MQWLLYPHSQAYPGFYSAALDLKASKATMEQPSLVPSLPSFFRLRKSKVLLSHSRKKLGSLWTRLGTTCE